jgi:hypothetical protein
MAPPGSVLTEAVVAAMPWRLLDVGAAALALLLVHHHVTMPLPSATPDRQNQD